VRSGSVAAHGSCRVVGSPGGWRSGGLDWGVRKSPLTDKITLCSVVRRCAGHAGPAGRAQGSRVSTLVLRTGTAAWRGGRGEPVTTVEVEVYELYRGLMSRRQMRAWNWSVDATIYLDALSLFGPRDDDQPDGELPPHP
jgi:hypothetical protein